MDNTKNFRLQNLRDNITTIRRQVSQVEHKTLTQATPMEIAWFSWCSSLFKADIGSKLQKITNIITIIHQRRTQAF